MIRKTLMMLSGLAILLAFAMPAQALAVPRGSSSCEDEVVAVNCVYYSDECSPSGNGEPCLPYRERHFCTLVLLGACVCWDAALSCIG
ncbi:MAG TPA: hypothetical protein VM241_04060 [Candidatus Thermoplasmatota archaeon]|nr:hypothetical protein [Candidatus Thermoplasmatota archaeon]